MLSMRGCGFRGGGVGIRGLGQGEGWVMMVPEKLERGKSCVPFRGVDVVVDLGVEEEEEEERA